VPAWQPPAGIVVVLATTLFCVWAAGRVFRLGILLQGKGANLTQMARWIFRG
jgi:ABC-2 type transport system permease protein